MSIENDKPDNTNPENPNGHASSENIPKENSGIKPGAKERPMQNFPITFHGSYTQYLGLSLYNLLLTVLTLGLYYPWAKCAIRKFLWQETEVAGSRFEWHGTGKEMFRGFIKAYLFIGVILITINFGPLFIPPIALPWVLLVCYILILAFIPLAIHGMARYRLSRTSFRGIQFGYRGDLGKFYKQTALDLFYTVISFGIYWSWLTVNIRKYVLGNARYGDVRGKFVGTGGDLFWLSFVQGILIVVTLYIYLPWAIIRFYRFDVENIRIYQGENNKLRVRTNASGGMYFLTLIKALLVTVFTLGICAPIGSLMIHKYLVESLRLEGWFDFDAVEQTEESYTDATGDDMIDILDFDF